MIVDPGCASRAPSATVGSGVASAELVLRFDTSEHYYGQREILWAVAALAARPDLVRGRDVIHIIDDDDAMAGLHCGYLSNVGAGLLVNAYHALQIALNCEVHCVKVEGDRNAGGPPSHADPQAVASALARLGLPEERLSFDDNPFIPSADDFSSPISVWFELVQASES